MTSALALALWITSVVAAGAVDPVNSLFEPPWFGINFSASSDLNKLELISATKGTPQPAIIEEILFLRSDSDKAVKVFFKENERKNVHLSFRFRAEWLSAKSDFGIILRTSPQKNLGNGIWLHFRRQPSKKILVLEVIDNRIKQVRKVNRIGNPDDYWHQCEVSLTGGRLVVYLDNSLVLRVGSLTVGKGGVGIEVNGGAKLWLDDLIVTGD